MLKFALNGDKKAYTVMAKQVDGKDVPIEGDLVISGTYEGLPVVRIGGFSFHYMPITSLTIGEGVTSIEMGAFKGCKQLKSVKLPSSLEIIDNEAFADCEALEEIVIPEGVTTIGESAFSGTSIKTLNLPSTLTFFKASTVERFELSENSQSFKEVNGAILTKNGDKLIAYPAGKSEDVYVIPEGVTVIGELAFANSKLKDIVMPSTLKTIEYGAFVNMPNLKKCVIPEGVERLGANIFTFEMIDYTNLALKELSVPNSLKIIDSYAIPQLGNFTGERENGVYAGKFLKVYENGLYLGNEDNPYLILTDLDDSDVETFTIHKDCKHIGQEAFSWCKNLKSIELPEGIISIGSYAFSHCDKIKELVFPKTLRYVSSKVLNGLPDVSLTFLCDDLDLIEDPYYWHDPGVYFKNYHTSCRFYFLGKYSYDMPNGYKIDLSKVTRRERYGDYDICEMPEVSTRKLATNTTLAEEVFGDVYEDVTQKGQRFLIGRSNFGDTTLKKPCYSIIEFINTKEGEDYYSGTTIDPYYHVLSVGDREEVELCDGVELIEADAFVKCPSVAKLTLPATVKKIQKGAFSECKNIKEVHFKGEISDWCNIKFASPNTNPLYKGATLFIEGEPVYELEIFDDVEFINSNAFCGANFKSVIVPESVTEIGTNAFGGCEDLVRIEIPFVGRTLKGEDNTHFGYIFGATSEENHQKHIPASLKEVVVTSAESIESNAFYDCQNIESLKILSAERIASGVIANCDSLADLYLPFLGSGYNATTAKLAHVYGYKKVNALRNLTIAHGRKLDAYAISEGIELNSLILPPELELVNVNNIKIYGDLEEVDGAYYIGSEDNPFYALYKVSETATSVKVTDMTEIILSNAFKGSSVTEVKLGKMVRIIAPRAFDEATKIKAVEFAVPLGWEYAPTSGGKVVDLKKTLTNAKKSAKLLTHKACEMHWRKR